MEPALARGDLISSDRQFGKKIAPGIVGLRSTREPRIGIGDCHVCPGNNRAIWIGDHTLNPTAKCLSRNRRYEQKRQNGNTSNTSEQGFH